MALHLGLALTTLMACTVFFATMGERVKYPKTPRELKYVDDYFGTLVPDPYRALESPTSYNTKRFIKSQKKLTDEYFDDIVERADIRESMKVVWNYPAFTAPSKFGSRYFFMANNGSQNQDVLYMQESLDAQPEAVLDANLESEAGIVSYSDHSFAKDGNLLVYSVSEGGSDWKKAKVRNVTSGEDLPDVLQRVKYALYSWTEDSKGFFYPQYPTDKEGKASSQNRRIFYHRISTNQSQDVLIWESPEHPTWLPETEVSQCGKYLIINIYEDYEPNAVHVAQLDDQVIGEGFQDKFVPVFPDVLEAKFEYLGNVNTTFYFLSGKNATNNNIISLNLARFMEASKNSSDEQMIRPATEVVIPENSKASLSWASLVGGKYFVLCYLADVRNFLKIVDLEGNEVQLQNITPEPGSISNFAGGKKNSTEFFIKYESQVTPGTIYRCDLVNKSFECEIHQRVMLDNINLDDFKTTQVYYPSKDGTAIPMSIVHHKNFSQDGTAPAILRGYGGFGVSYLPSFSITKLFFLQAFGGIYATANVRGGGEYGKNWHEEGRREKKQNVFDDFIAAAEYLIDENYTNPKQLAATGSSNGGLMVAACINQRPELFGAANVDVGLLDMLRFQKFTAGFHWCIEYGCSDNKTSFKTLIKYSPIHNVRVPLEEAVQYPAILVTTADRDDRVVPAHSYKYVAELQHTIGNSPRQENPLLLRVELDSGHGEGNSDSKTFDQNVDVFSFFYKTMGLNFTSLLPFPPGMLLSKTLF